MDAVEEAVGLFGRGYACSQAVLLAYAPELGLDDGPATRIAAGFAAGMRAGEACGAATGAVMVLGLSLCGSECATREGRAEVARAVGTFTERFRERVGAIDCPDIIGCDLRQDGAMAAAMEQNLFATRCAPAVRAAAETIEDIVRGS